MITPTVLDPRLRHLRLANVQAYLARKGWKQRPFPRPQTLWFEGPLDDSGNAIVQLVPSSEGVDDYALRMEELVRALSVIENRDTQAVLLDLMGVNGTPAGKSQSEIPTVSTP